MAQTGIRHADEVRNYLRDNVLTTYNPASAWKEDEEPFTLTDDPIIYTRQEGLAVDAFSREVVVTVYLFTKVNATNADMSVLFDDAVAALEFIRANEQIQEFNWCSVNSDVTGEYYTGQNRRYYTFSVLCHSYMADH